MAMQSERERERDLSSSNPVGRPIGHFFLLFPLLSTFCSAHRSLTRELSPPTPLPPTARPNVHVQKFSLASFRHSKNGFHARAHKLGARVETILMMDRLLLLLLFQRRLQKLWVVHQQKILVVVVNVSNRRKSSRLVSLAVSP